MIKKNRLIQQQKDKVESIDLSDIPSLEGDEEVNKGEGLKILTPNKYQIDFQLLLQIKAGNN